jgi:hypothetical protein
MKSLHATVFAIALAGALALVSATASAHPDSSQLDDGVNEGGGTTLELPWGDGDDHAHDEPVGDPGLPDTLGATGSKTLDVVGRGIRNEPGVTTDVWAHDGYAYTGTFSTLCSTGGNDSGIWIWDVHNVNKVSFVGVIDSPAGSKANDVRVAGMNSGDILVLSNESCAGGPGGFDIYNVDDPANPVFESRVQIDELNPISDFLFGGITDVGVHNLWLFTDGANDYVAVTSEGAFDNFRVYDITDPANPTLASSWGAEELFDPGVGEETVDVGRVLDAALDLLGGFGASQNKFLHDVTIAADGNTAYLANWDAGLVALDISDPTVEPTVISVAIDPVNGSLDGEVNSHSVWPSEDGSIVIEGEEDFSAWEGNIPPSGLTADGTATPGDPTIPVTAVATNAGDFFQATPTGLTGSVHGASIEVDGGPEFGAVEMTTAAGSPTLADTGDISGNIVYVGRACGLTAGDVLENPVSAGDIAIVRRGACEFDEKAQTVAAAGAAVAVIANNQQSTPWSGMRIWDYSDPANPVLASTFNTACSASTAPSSSCVADGTYSSHNVVVETTDDGQVLAYIAWYNDGIIVLDITNPYTPVEIARYLGTNEDGDLNDFWGIYKIPNQPFIYASDRSGGLYIFKLKGKGLQKGN